MKPRGGLSVMQNRREPPDTLEFFATPPWATRALVEHVLQPLGYGRKAETAWEPACGEGHMAEPLREYFGHVQATDIFDYGYGDDCQDFLRDDPPAYSPATWIITNPPFRLATAFARRALDLKPTGVALLVRSSWLEGQDRYVNLFRPHPPAVVAQFVERVPMVKGAWDPEATTATSYSWICWLRFDDVKPGGTVLMWIPPGQRRLLTKPDDVERFARRTDAPLLSGAGA